MKQREGLKLFNQEINRLKEQYHIKNLMTHKNYDELRKIMFKEMDELKRSPIRKMAESEGLNLRPDEVKNNIKETLFLGCCLNIPDDKIFEDPYKFRIFILDMRKSKDTLKSLMDELRFTSIRKLIEIAEEIE